MTCRGGWGKPQGPQGGIASCPSAATTHHPTTMDLATIDTADLIAELASRFPRFGHPSSGDGLDAILRIVSEVHGVHPGDIISRSRRARICNARFQFIVAAMDRHPGLSLSEMGQYLDERDHSTITHALKAHHQIILFDDHYKALWAATVNRL
jgi:chromosomal replication initiation ATPase DnaA